MTTNFYQLSKSLAGIIEGLLLLYYVCTKCFSMAYCFQLSPCLYSW